MRTQLHNRFALAVHEGDVSAVPLPAAAWLLASGIFALIGLINRRSVFVKVFYQRAKLICMRALEKRERWVDFI